jgi:TctA family transporter
MDLLSNLALGVAVAFTPQNLLYAFVGCVLGTLIGVLPGLGPVAAIAMLLPVVHALDATTALIMLAGVYYGAQYGGSTAAILLDSGGPSTSAAAAADGQAMARQGRAGPALAAAALGSFFAGCVGTVVIAAIAPPLTDVAFSFGPAEYVSLMVAGLIGAVVLTSGSLLKAVAMIVLGLLLAQIGADVVWQLPRFSFGLPELHGGINFVVVAIGMFGLGEVIATLAQPAEPRTRFVDKVTGLWPTRQDLRDAWPAMLRGTALGSLLGMLPGGGALLASVAAQAVEKTAPGRRGEVEFGKGNIRGVAAPESANNAGAQTSFVPMLALGVPPNAVMALMIGAMLIKGIAPGPPVLTAHPELFWGLVASMWAGNVMLLVLNLPLVGLWARLLAVPYRWLAPALVLLCCVGVYSLRGSAFDVALSALFALAGYAFHQLGCEGAPLLLGFVLGPMLEQNLRHALQLSGGDWSTFVTRPLSAGLLIAGALMIVVVWLPTISKKRGVAFVETE